MEGNSVVSHAASCLGVHEELLRPPSAVSQV
jgi:hypothetical protein